MNPGDTLTPRIPLRMVSPDGGYIYVLKLRLKRQSGGKWLYSALVTEEDGETSHEVREGRVTQAALEKAVQGLPDLPCRNCGEPIRQIDFRPVHFHPECRLTARPVSLRSNPLYKLAVQERWA